MRGEFWLGFLWGEFACFWVLRAFASVLYFPFFLAEVGYRACENKSVIFRLFLPLAKVGYLVYDNKSVIFKHFLRET